jgi:hypothetical protein
MTLLIVSGGLILGLIVMAFLINFAMRRFNIEFDDLDGECGN